MFKVENSKQKTKYIYIVKSSVRKKVSKIIITSILTVILISCIHAYNNKISAKVNKDVSVTKVMKAKNEVKKIKSISALLDKDGNRNYTFNYTFGNFHIVGSKKISYDTLVINGVERKNVIFLKEENDYIIKFKGGSITIDNYYKNNKIENICFSSDIRKINPKFKNLYKFLLDKNNCDSLFKTAVKLNSGEKTDTCVFFVSEALRKQKENIDKGVCYTGRYQSNIVHNNSLIYTLLNNGWKIDYDVKNLMPGDLCFTIDVKGKDGGYPTHVYTFMQWEKPNSTENAYIVDNQGYKYNGEFYHLRNVTIDKPKDKFHFFMYKPA